MIEKTYKIKLQTHGLVHTGSGDKANKKDYVLNEREKTLEFLNMRKFNQLVYEEGLADEHMDFILHSSNGLFEFIKEYGLMDKYKKTISYRLDGSVLSFRNDKALNNLSLAYKDPYQNPYIPGSSLKGALVQNLLFYTAMTSSDEIKDKFYGRFEEIDYLSNKNKRKKNNKYKDLNRDILDFLTRKILKDNKASYKDLGLYLSVGDSNSLSPQDLILAQKIDLGISAKGERYDKESKLNLIREVFAPGSQLEFDLKLKNTDLISLQLLKKAIIKTFYSLKKLHRYAGYIDRLQGAYIYLGGGVGFISKTLQYGMFGDIKKATNIVANYLEFQYSNVDREEDRNLGLAPKTIKFGQTNKSRIEMGLCKLDFEEIGP